jgi:hypothetical protein
MAHDGPYSDRVSLCCLALVEGVYDEVEGKHGTYRTLRTFKCTKCQKEDHRVLGMAQAIAELAERMRGA